MAGYFDELDAGAPSRSTAAMTTLRAARSSLILGDEVIARLREKSAARRLQHS